MRLRKIKYAAEYLASQTDVVFLEANKLYDYIVNDLNNKEVHLEIGCGKGQFITTLAKNNPDINYIAMEKFDSVLIRSVEKVEENKLDNLKFVLGDAENILDYIPKHSVDVIYLNFSDPWPKNRHSKRRLSSKEFLENYKEILKENGRIIQKTDNRQLFAFSLEEYCKNDFYLENISLDLHKDNEDIVTTEFEDKYSKLGPIYYLEAKLK